MINKPPTFPKIILTYNHIRAVVQLKTFYAIGGKKGICFPLSMLLYFPKNLISVGGQSKFNFPKNYNFPPTT